MTSCIFVYTGSNQTKYSSISIELFPHEDSELIDLAGEDLFSSFGPVSPLVRSRHAERTAAHLHIYFFFLG